MKTTYNEILENMKNKFTECCGEKVENMGDINARFEAVASELYNLACYEDYILKQALPHTATGDFLDKHASLRGVSRKAASKAVATVTFSIDEPIETRIKIPKGTLCSCEDKPFIQFETTQPAYIEVGQTTGSAIAMATDFGSDFNVEAGKINVIVNPLQDVTGVTNLGPSLGGLNKESDEDFRVRFLSIFNAIPNGINLNAIQACIESIDQVRKCKIERVDNILNIYIASAYDFISSELENNIRQYMGWADLMGLSYNIICAQPIDICLDFGIKTNDFCNIDEIKVLIGQRLQYSFGLFDIGCNFDIYAICNAIAKIDCIEFAECLNFNPIRINNNQYPVFSVGEVICYD